MKKIFNRLNIAIFGLFMQVLLIILFFDFIIHYFNILFLVTYIVNFLVVKNIIKEDKASAFKTSWIVIILSFPVVGIIIYGLVKNPFQTKKIKENLKKEAEKSAQLLAGYEMTNKEKRIKGIANYISDFTGYPAYENIHVEYYSLGQYMFADMKNDLKKAKKFIFLQYFVVKDGEMWDQIEEIIIKKAKEGLDVRLIFDDIGSAALMTEKYKKKLKEKNIKILIFSKITPIFSTFENNRNHRKILVIDGKIAYNGGVNISDEYINLNNNGKLWKDIGTRLCGEAVFSFTLMSIETWNAFCGKDDTITDYEFYKYKDFSKKNDHGLVIPYGDNPLTNERIGENVYIDILNKATDYVYIFTPFLILSEYMIYAMKMAKKRGVDVRLILPGIPDWETKSSSTIQNLNKSYYKYLQDDGIKIYEYPDAFVHAKSFVSDDKIAVVGTINLDYRSLYLNFECGILFYEGETIGNVKNDWLDTMDKSVEVIGNELTLLKRFVNNILILFIELL